MIKIICVGKVKEKYLRDAISDYEKRISKYYKIDIILSLFYRKVHLLATSFLIQTKLFEVHGNV